MPPILPFTGPWLLAPMEGVTEPSFRDLVLELHSPRVLGGAFTEFVRVVSQPLPARSLRQALGPRRHGAPVGLQLMGADPAALAETARRAVEAGAPLVDLNFGCPSRGALRGCAGSALLEDPASLEQIVRVCVDALGNVPVTAKIRAGGEDDARLEELARAAQAGGASLLTLHCRTRAEGYGDCADWRRIARTVAAVSIPVCGNGGVERHEDLEKMRAETGCHLVMVGRAALSDPWVFSGQQVSRATSARFLLDYAERLRTEGGASDGQALARVKQLLRSWRAGSLVDAQRERWLRERDPARMFAWLREQSTGPTTPPRTGSEAYTPAERTRSHA